MAEGDFPLPPRVSRAPRSLRACLFTPKKTQKNNAYILQDNGLQAFEPIKQSSFYQSNEEMT